MEKGKIVKVGVLELIRDWNLWPRYEAQELDSTNLTRIKQAILAGEKLPPIVVDAKSLRIVDGFHRQETYLKLYGDNAEVEVEARDYKNDAEMFKDAMELNAKGSLLLTPQDKVHCIIKGRKFKLSFEEIAKSLGMTVDKIKSLKERRVATTKEGEKIPVAYGAINLSDYSREKRSSGKTLKPLTAKEEMAVRTANGVLPIVKIRLLLNILRANALYTDKEFELLAELHTEIDRVLGRRIAA